MVKVSLYRDGTHADDTLGDTVDLLGWLVEYTADS
jgi:hypothetical protein